MMLATVVVDPALRCGKTIKVCGFRSVEVFNKRIALELDAIERGNAAQHLSYFVVPPAIMNSRSPLKIGGGCTFEGYGPQERIIIRWQCAEHGGAIRAFNKTYQRFF